MEDKQILNIKSIIKRRILELYGKNKIKFFCNKNKINYSTHGRTIKKFERWIEEINKYLELLNLEINITEKPNKK